MQKFILSAIFILMSHVSFGQSIIQFEVYDKVIKVKAEDTLRRKNKCDYSSYLYFKENNHHYELQRIIIFSNPKRDISITYKFEEVAGIANYEAVDEEGRKILVIMDINTIGDKLFAFVSLGYVNMSEMFYMRCKRK